MSFFMLALEENASLKEAPPHLEQAPPGKFNFARKHPEAIRGFTVPQFIVRIVLIKRWKF